MVSTPFANEQYRNQGDKATEKRNRYQKVIICPSEPHRLVFAYCGAILALPGRFFGYSGAILERMRIPFIDYSGAKYAHFAPKIAAAQKLLFRVVENLRSSDRLQNDHLKKSAVMGIRCLRCSPVTAKLLLNAS